MTAKKQPPKKPLPAALAKNAARAARARGKEVLAGARADMALIREKMQTITDAFYDIGLALQRLSKPGVAETLGFKSYGDLVVRGLELSLSGASTLVDIVTWVNRQDALVWGREKSAALIDLAKATPANDTPASLMRARVKLANGKKVDLRKLDAKSILEAAKEERHALDKEGKPQRGFTTTPAERARGKRLEGELRRAGLKDARVQVVARRVGGALARIDVPVTRLDALAKAAKAAERA